MSGRDAAVHVAQRLRDDLRSGALHPRERLVEADLVARYATSRSVVRNALVELAAEGLIERQPHRGARVRGLTIREGVEFAEVRRELEALCARDAANAPASAETVRLGRLLEALRHAASAGDLVTYRRESAGFHALVIAMSGHESAQRQLEPIRMHDLQLNFPVAFAARPLQASEGEHEAIAQAILAGDAALAASSMWSHLDRVVRILAEHRDARGGES